MSTSTVIDILIREIHEPSPIMATMYIPITGKLTSPDDHSQNNCRLSLFTAIEEVHRGRKRVRSRIRKHYQICYERKAGEHRVLPFYSLLEFAHVIVK